MSDFFQIPVFDRHNTVPRLSENAYAMDARYYNLVQLALRRLGEPIRSALPGLKVMDIILQKDAWIVVDRVHNDLPVIAWCDFESSKRTALDAPVTCQQRWFHAHASMITKQALETTIDLLSQDLGVDRDNLADVIELKETNQP